MAEEKKKLTYEELEGAVNALVQENNELKGRLHQTLTQLKEYADFSAFKRLDYLFKVVESQSAFKSEFVVSCVEEIEMAMFPPKEEEDNEEKK